MIRVTDQAAAELRDVLDANDAESGYGMKLVLDESGEVRFRIAPASPKDEVMYSWQEPLLILDLQVGKRLVGLALDVQIVEEAGQPRKQFILRSETS